MPPVDKPKPAEADPATRNMEILRSCFASAASAAHLPPGRFDGDRKLAAGKSYTLDKSDAKALYDLGFARPVWTDA